MSPCEMFPFDKTPFPLLLALSDFELDTLNWHSDYLSNWLIEVTLNIYFSIIRNC